MFEVAQKADLPIEYLDGMPAQIDGWLDSHTTPRFISVNRNLPQHEQVFAIARELGFYAQQRLCNSLILDRPWKWEVLARAPEELRQKIRLLDAGHRAHWLMLFFATGDEFRAFVKKHPKKVLAIIFTDNIVGFHLYALRIKTWYRNVLRAFAIS
jgi:hypothetical protein